MKTLIKNAFMLLAESRKKYDIATNC